MRNEDFTLENDPIELSRYAKEVLGKNEYDFGDFARHLSNKDLLNLSNYFTRLLQIRLSRGLGSL